MASPPQPHHSHGAEGSTRGARWGSGTRSALVLCREFKCQRDPDTAEPGKWHLQLPGHQQVPGFPTSFLGVSPGSRTWGGLTCWFPLLPKIAYCVGAQLLSHVQLFMNPWTIAHFVHGIFQGRILEWGAISFSRGSSQSRDQTCVSWIGRWILYH